MAASGHVNMMDDVLISNLSPVLLRSALRTLVSQGATTQRPFVEHIRRRLQETPPPLTDAQELFPQSLRGSNDGNHTSSGVVSQACSEYIALTRCVFSSKLAMEALP
ncbi:hypothetical protein BD289DRAFT_487345 [Coniella lustricola]|uniref:Uncharacterized protein n=1 Tax=Coniella lustricola TaxID=2025994 RepID=A0A2T2ZS58_9PEZI|nr:hypothetical protein BD289DRAFT_487345 [Coniella lustricola]